TDALRRGVCHGTSRASVRAENKKRGDRTMSRVTVRLVGVIACLGVGGLWAASAQADGNLGKVNHIIIVMQENHSFDNYFGVLPNAPPLTSQVPGRYHGTQGNGPCPTTDHTCVDSLNCTRDTAGNYSCTN